MAWLQNPVSLPYFKDGKNIIPTIHVKDLAKIVKTVIDKKPEQRYIFAVDRTIDKSAKNLIYSISKGIGSGKTVSIQPEDMPVEKLKFGRDDVYIDQKISEKKKLEIVFTENELKWPNFLSHDLDIWFTNSKFIEEEFDWYCKEGIPANINKILKEFCQYRELRPLKIIINSANKEERKVYAEMISKAYNIPIINDFYIMDMLQLMEEELDEEDRIMKRNYLEMKKIKDGNYDPLDTVNYQFLLSISGLIQMIFYMKH